MAIPACLLRRRALTAHHAFTAISPKSPISCWQEALRPHDAHYTPCGRIAGGGSARCRADGRMLQRAPGQLVDAAYVRSTNSYSRSAGRRFWSRGANRSFQEAGWGPQRAVIAVAEGRFRHWPLFRSMRNRVAGFCFATSRSKEHRAGRCHSLAPRSGWFSTYRGRWVGRMRYCATSIVASDASSTTVPTALISGVTPRRIDENT